MAAKDNEPRSFGSGRIILLPHKLHKARTVEAGSKILGSRRWKDIRSGADFDRITALFVSVAVVAFDGKIVGLAVGQTGERNGFGDR